MNDARESERGLPADPRTTSVEINKYLAAAIENALRIEYNRALDDVRAAVDAAHRKRIPIFFVLAHIERLRKPMIQPAASVTPTARDASASTNESTPAQERGRDE